MEEPNDEEDDDDASVKELDTSGYQMTLPSG